MVWTETETTAFYAQDRGYNAASQQITIPLMEKVEFEPHPA
jgi:hypothetical protein